jgi:CRISPR-associated protein Csy3
LKLPSRLTYTRSISPSIGVFLSVDADKNTTPLNIQTIKVLGQKSSASEAFDKKAELKESTTAAKLAEGNPHTVEYCHVPYECKTLLCKFSVRVNANSFKPSNCNDNDASEFLRHFSEAYNKHNGYKYLAQRYLDNIIKGTWLWRNSEALNIDIKITTQRNVEVIFENISVNKYEESYPENVSGYNELVDQFTQALCDPKFCLFAEVEAKITPSFMQEIYPSQAFTEKNSDIGRVYQDTIVDGKRTAILGAYKIGAALALVDDWYPDCDETIRVGAFGVIKDSNTSVRHPESKLDLYSLLMDIENITSELADNNNLESRNKAHFVAANLIKGGLFQLGR